MPRLNLPYVAARLTRHFMPERLTRFLLLHSILIKPGLETSDPVAAVDRYLDVLKQRGQSIQGKRVLVFGYGGRFDVGVGLLEAGAGHVVLCERYAPPDDIHNAALVSAHGRFLTMESGKPRPLPDVMTLIQADVRALQTSAEFPPFDYVLSSSVYEHLEGVDGITRALAALTRPQGVHLHYVDLRDHFFKYPFEMLTYSETTWRRWLNPTSNHNRFRVSDYSQTFRKYFDDVEVSVLARDEQAFQAARTRIQPTFLTGNPQDDSVTLILVIAARPIQRSEK